MKLLDTKSYDISTALNVKLKGQYHSAVCENGRFSERTLIRAKKGIPVSAQTVNFIASALGCQPEDLLKQNDICWLSGHNANLTNPAAINIHASLSEFIDGVIATAGILSNELEQNDLELSIESNGTVLRIELTHLKSGVTDYWNVRPGYPGDNGITYVESSESAELQLGLEVERLRRCVTDNVIINGVKQFSYLHKPGWLVMFHKFKPNDFESYVGEQHFLNAKDFQATFNKWLSGNNVTDVNRGEGNLVLSTDQKELSWNAIEFYRANFGPGGGTIEASVTASLAKKIVSQIRSGEKQVNCIADSKVGVVRELGPCEQSVSTY